MTNEKNEVSSNLTVFPLLSHVGELLFFLLTLLTLVVLPLIKDYLRLADAAEWLLAVGKWPLLLLAVGFVVAMLYRCGPSREKAQWRWLTWGGAFAAVGWLVVSVLFSWYAANFGRYNKTYGSLGAVVGFMTWIWLSCIVMLLGAELDAETEHQTARDTTTGPPAPMGRGAPAWRTQLEKKAIDRRHRLSHGGPVGTRHQVRRRLKIAAALLRCPQLCDKYL